MSSVYGPTSTSYGAANKIENKQRDDEDSPQLGKTTFRSSNQENSPGTKFDGTLTNAFDSRAALPKTVIKPGKNKGAKDMKAIQEKCFPMPSIPGVS